MAECQGCHYLFPKPDMKKVVTRVGGGYTPPRTTTKLDKNLQPVGYSQSQGTYRQGREKTLWFCSECYEKHKADQKRGCLYGVMVALALIFVLIIYQAVKRERADDASVNQAELQQQPVIGSQIEDADGLPPGQLDGAPVPLEAGMDQEAHSVPPSGPSQDLVPETPPGSYDNEGRDTQSLERDPAAAPADPCYGNRPCRTGRYDKIGNEIILTAPVPPPGSE